MINTRVVTETVREAVCKAFSERCFYTGRKTPLDEGHVDHIVPKSAGGEHTFANYVWAAKDVNLKKHATQLASIEATRALLKAVYAPKIEAEYRRLAGGTTSMSWIQGDIAKELNNRIGRVVVHDESIYTSDIDVWVREGAEEIINRVRFMSPERKLLRKLYKLAELKPLKDDFDVQKESARFGEKFKEKLT